MCLIDCIGMQETRKSSPSGSSHSCQRSFIVQLADVASGSQLSKSDAKPYISVKVAYSAT